MAAILAQQTEKNPSYEWCARRFWGLFLIIGTSLAYLPALNGRFVWDDGSWTTDILGLLRDWSGLQLMWCNPVALQQYYPLSGTTFWLDYHFWQLWTLPYHVENLLLHIGSVLLFWKLLDKLKVSGAWLAAAFFALHPVMVESVAWITERKNVLSMFFFLGALLAYGRFNSFWETGNVILRRWGAYALAFLLFVLALLAKTTVFSLPAVMLLIYWWKHGSINWRKEILPSLPFFIAAIGFSGVTAWVEKNHVGATGWEWDISFPERCLTAGRAFWFYVGNLFCPAHLCFIYPRWQPDVGVWWQWLFPISVPLAIYCLWLGRKKIGRGQLVVFLYFLGTLFPVLGFMNAYGTRYSFVWDHWVYLSSLGFFTWLAASLGQLAKHWQKNWLLPGVAALVLPLMAILTWRQCLIYKDVETLWRATIVNNPKAFIAYNNLGYQLLQNNQVEEAIPYFKKSLNIAPYFFEARNNLGDAAMRLGHMNEAIKWFQETACLAPTYVAAHYNLGNAYLKIGHNNEAIAQFGKALALDPSFAKANNNLGVALMRAGKWQEAMTCFEKAIGLDPQYTDAHNNLANLLATQGQSDAALEQYQTVLQIDSNYVEAYSELGNLLVTKGKGDEAVPMYQEAVRLKPDYQKVHYNLAVVLAAQGKLDEAVQHFQTAIQLKPDDANAHGNLANVLVGQNKLDEAVEHYRQTLQLEPNSDQAHYKLGLALAKQLKTAEAIQQFQQALRLNPNHAGAKKELRLLGALPD